MSRTVPNWYKLSSTMSVVRTQAGFKKALKDYQAYIEHTEVFNGNFPEQYPSLVVFGFAYQGYHFITVDILPMSTLREVVHQDMVDTITLKRKVT